MNIEDIIYTPLQEEAIANVDVQAQEQPLDISKYDYPIEIDIKNLSSYPNEVFALVRRNGFGGSDSSVLLGVNPYKTIDELIKEKATDTLSEEEKAIGEKVAVRKGNDLEPLIIDKFHNFFKVKTLKPTDMYRFKEYPYLTMNFDGVAVPDNAPMYPVEIKVVTAYGEKHYNPAKAIFREAEGFFPYPENVADSNLSIQSKAAHYGIPPYYYTQLQMEMMALNAEFGLLTAMFDKSWRLATFFVYKDAAVQNQIILNGYKAWEKVEMLRAKNGVDLSLESILARTSSPQSENMESKDFLTS